MTSWHLILRNLSHYRKPYLSTLLGVAISTAVITGALVVGDSVRDSLQQHTLQRLGTIRFSVQTKDRLFRQVLADSLQNKLHSEVCPVMQSEGIAVNPDKETRINRVEVIGMDQDFPKFWANAPAQPGEGEAVISSNMAEKLQLNVGEELILRVKELGKVPANAPFASSATNPVSIRLKVSAIAEEKNMGSFSLQNNQLPPYTIFVPIENFSKKLKIEGYANLLLFADNETHTLSSGIIEAAIHSSWTTEDAGLHLQSDLHSGNVEMISDRIFIGSEIASSIKYINDKPQAFLTYLVNSISAGSQSTPYSFVTAAENEYLGQSLTDQEAILNSWLADDLNVKVGDSVMFRYYVMGPMRSLKEDSCRLAIKSIADVHSPIFDSTLMPAFPGMSGAGNCRDWETSAPVDLKKIRDKDEDYWKIYRGTPKAFISLALGQKIWKNPFGDYTSLRFQANTIEIQQIKNRLMQDISPASQGFIALDVRKQGELSAANSTDFAGLFLSLGFFIILSGLLLTALLFGMHLSKRIPETAILSTLGFTSGKVARLLIIELLFITFSGSALGVILGIGYNHLLVWGLNTVWVDAVGTSMLQVKIEAGTLLIGAISGMLVSLLMLLLVLFRSLRYHISIAVKGSPALKNFNIKLKRRYTGIIAALSLLISIGMLLYPLMNPVVNQSEVSMFAGAILMLSAVSYLAHRLYRNQDTAQKGLLNLKTLVFRNITLNRKRTITAVSLLALGTFSVIITGANRKSFEGIQDDPASGTGGFLLWAESTLPFQDDLNSYTVRKKYGLEYDSLFRNIKFVQLNLVEGDDASCLNLNQVSNPVLTGIPTTLFDQRKCFSFDKLLLFVDRISPWTALEQAGDSDVIPAFADQTVITWGLMKSLGDTLKYKNEFGKTLNIRIIGGLKNSIFQGKLLVSDRLLQKHFPASSRNTLFLAEGPSTISKELTKSLEMQFMDYGIVVTSTAKRLEAFNAVENTYLSVFMIMGGLGLIIGVFGLGIVLLRNTNERKQELAIYQALGFEKKVIFGIILREYLFVLISGITIGLMAALLGSISSINSSFSKLPWQQLLGILILILISGLLWIYFPARLSMKKNLTQSLREE